MRQRSKAQGFVPAARVTRGEQVESWHFAAAAVVTPGGERVCHLGDPSITTCLRSASKPFQILPLLLAGGELAFDLSDRDLALICASHGGRPEHTERAQSLLQRGGFSIDDLLCGAHEPMDSEAAAELRRRGRNPTPLHNNCSGKHSGMLLATKLLGWPKEGYVERDHPLQRRIREHLARCCRVEESTIGHGIDGCSLPAFFISIEAAARGYAALAGPLVGGDGDLDDQTARTLDRVARAMGSAPEMVAGPGRFTTRLMEVTNGRLVAKEGAEGFYGVAIREPTRSGAPDGSPGPVERGGLGGLGRLAAGAPLAVAVKIADGGERCRDAIVIEILRQIGALDEAELGQLATFRRTALRNHRDLPVGAVEADFTLAPN